MSTNRRGSLRICRSMRQKNIHCQRDANPHLIVALTPIALPLKDTILFRHNAPPRVESFNLSGIFWTFFTESLDFSLLPANVFNDFNEKFGKYLMNYTNHWTRSQSTVLRLTKKTFPVLTCKLNMLSLAF